MTTTRSRATRPAAANERAPRTSPEPAGARPEPNAGEPGSRRTIIVERLWPALDGGRYPVKRVVGDRLLVTADILADGHDLLDAALLLRADGEERWLEAPMRQVENDRWSGTISLNRNARHHYAVEAWRDRFGSLHHALQAKVGADAPYATEIAEALILLAQAAARAGAAKGRPAANDARTLADAVGSVRRARSDATRAAVVLRDEVLEAARRHPDRSWATRSIELPLMVDRELARTGAWYELFPRSQSRDPGRATATTLEEAAWRLPEIAKLGFDVVYLPPIHPIGRTNRKGPNNTLDAGPRDVGSPYAIGSPDGGHDAVASELGGLEGFLRFREAVERHGMEVALDIAIQASPDHPWVETHPEWFRHAPDGTIKFAENPPKKYQDIYPIEFANDDPDARAALWQAWRDIFLAWVQRGVKAFRVDNPHTKPIPFWEWLIGEIQREHPEVIFLSEAFTRPKVMQQLGKVGFSQSYTYFTWRETRDELRQYLVELTQSEMREYFRGNLFTNTPDINPRHTDLGRPAFVIRTVLAATLSSSYGIYSGWELCEHARLGDREEYLDSEKYEIRARDWDEPGNIKDLIAALNRIRRERSAMQFYDNLRFEAVTGSRTLFYRKALALGEPDALSGYPYHWRDPVYVAVNCDATTAERALLHPDLPAVGIGWDEPYEMVDLMSGAIRRERGADLMVDLDPSAIPFSIFTIRSTAG
jgi:starch synthase (maltosyl-transferring)